MHSALIRVRYLLIMVGMISSLLCAYFVASSLSRLLLFEKSAQQDSSMAVGAENGKDRTVKIVTEAREVSAKDPDATLNQRFGRIGEKLLQAQYWQLRPDSDTTSKFDSLPLWGSYRPGHYFGLRSRHPSASLATGILWGTDDSSSLRHCPSLDEVERFDWIRHDGNRFGQQRIIDSRIDLTVTTSFVLTKGMSISSLPSSMEIEAKETVAEQWMQKISLRSSSGNNDVSHQRNLFFYLGADCGVGGPSEYKTNCFQLSGMTGLRVENELEDGGLLRIFGESSLTGSFTLTFVAVKPAVDETCGQVTNCTAKVSYGGYRGLEVDQGARDIMSQFRRQDHRAGRRDLPQSLKFDEFDQFNNQFSDPSNFLAFKFSTAEDIDLFVAFKDQIDAESNKVGICEGPPGDIAQRWEQMVAGLSRDFEEKFEAMAGSIIKVIDPAMVEASKVTLSSLLGGVGYFLGYPMLGNGLEVDSRAQDVKVAEDTKAIPTPSSPLPLISATPSRTVFPRGFLWDEGFHQLLLIHWNSRLTMTVLANWLNAMYFFTADLSSAPDLSDELLIGWIPREMILGDDASSRVPDEFRTQRVNTANPPTFMLVVEALMDRALNDEERCEGPRDPCFASGDDIDEFLRAIYPRLDAWITWFLTTQRGMLSYTYRWRGRSMNDGKVVPNTLASGLDDFPRGVFPVAEEIHVDLQCWVLKAVKIMRKLTTFLLKDNNDPGAVISRRTETKTLRRRLEWYDRLEKEVEQRLELYWSSTKNGFFDLGIHNESAGFITEVLYRCVNEEKRTAIDGFIPVQYMRAGVQFCPPDYPTPLSPMSDGSGGYRTRERLVAGNWSYQHINHVGYVSLFPLLLKLLPADSDRLPSIFSMMKNSSLLSSDFGLRSLSKEDAFYQRRNAPGDAPYWRGHIWINVNYLALSALKFYSQSPGRHQAEALELYDDLRDRLLTNVFKEYLTTGFLWEQYDDSTGKGIRGHPFTGWTSLIVAILYELY